MKNVQIRFNEDLLKAIDRLAASYQISRSARVREALENWIRQREFMNLKKPGSANSKRIRMILQTRKHGCTSNNGGIDEPGPLNAEVGMWKLKVRR
jgi:metal-responsive CopG/Arc/MetJ family transcriptional regulator